MHRWDTAVGIPDKKTGIPDMTFRYAENCFVYDPHQWINQGCVATDLKLEGRSLGVPLNKNGGGGQCVFIILFIRIIHHNADSYLFAHCVLLIASSQSMLWSGIQPTHIYGLGFLHLMGESRGI